MAIYRNIHLSFWSDPKIQDDFTPEDKYFYLYLLTNPHTNLAGCYEISKKQMADETGYSRDTIDKLVERMTNTHEVIKYSSETKEVYILNWHKYNWQGSDKQFKAISGQLENVKCDEFREQLSDTLWIGYAYPMDTTDTDTDTDNNTDLKDNDKSIDIIINIVNYLNNTCNLKYKYTTRKTQSLIRARLKEGFTEDDFKVVIDKKFAEWGDDNKMSRYLRPETLFGTKFESYLNQSDTKKSKLERWKMKDDKK